MDEERYEINSLIGKGRTGGVYAAEDTQLKRSVAVRRFYTAGGDTSSADWEDEFLTISQNLGNLHASNLLTVLEAGVDDDGAFLVTNFIEGKRLSERVTKAPLDEHVALDMASQLLDGLASSHEAGFIHGALTAGSIMLAERPRGGYRYIIMDMGLSRLAPLIQGVDSCYAMMADPALLAPELFDGEPATAASDCYMLGQLIYLSLIGGHPFALKPLDTIKELHQTGALPPLSDYIEGLTPAFTEWISVLTNPDIAMRPQSAAEALTTLPKPPSKTAISPPAVITKNKLTAAAPIKLNTAVTPASQPTTTAPAKELAATPFVVNAPQTKSKKKLILAITIPLLLVTAVCIAFISPVDSGTDSFYVKTTDSKAVNKEPESPSEFTKTNASKSKTTEIYSNAVDAGHSRIGCDVSDKGKLDWVVFSYPLKNWDKHSHPQANIIKKISALGEPTFESQAVGNLLFFGNKKSKIRPNLFAKSAKVGDGWKIEILSSDAKFPLTLKFHFTTWSCDAKLRILSANGETELVPASEHKHNSENASFGISQKLTKEQLKDHAVFIIELTATDIKSKKNSGLSLNALIIK